MPFGLHLQCLMREGDTTTSLTNTALNVARKYATATLLQDGRVLLVGGYDVNFVTQTSAEVWNPATGQWSLVGAMQAARSRHSASLLSNGKVLIAGGSANNVFPANSELFDPASNSFSASGNLTTPREDHKAQQLSDGSIALFGGTNSNFYVTRNIEKYNPSNGTWTSLGDMLSNRGSFGIAPLPNGKVLLAAGYVYPHVVNSAELFDAGCADAVVSVSPSGMSFPVAGGSGTFQVTQRAGCGWAIANFADFVTITSPTSGVGNGTVNFTVAANTAEARGFRMQIANTSFYVSQATNVLPCNASYVPSIYPTSAVFPASGASGSITVNHHAGCSWSVSNVPSWMTITSATSGRGNGAVTYTVAPNSGAYRVNNLTIATQWFNAGQQAYVAPPAVCTSKAISSGVSVSGNLTSSACTNGARGSSYYTDRYTFTAVPGKQISIQLSSSAFDSYLYLKDPNGTVLTSNDDGGGGTNSRIPATSGTYTLPAGAGGTYSIEVTSYGQRSTGAYTLLHTMN